MIVSLASVKVVNAPNNSVGEPAAFAVVNDEASGMVAVAIDIPDVVVVPFGWLPEAVAELVTPLLTPAALLISVTERM